MVGVWYMIPLNAHNHLIVNSISFIPILQIIRLRHMSVKQCAQDHVVEKWQT